MKIKPFKIEIQDTNKYCDVAFVVDKQEFIDKINLIRKKWKITKSIQRKKLDEWRLQMQKDNKFNDFYRDIAKARYDLGLTSNFDMVIEKAVACGTIYDTDYNSVFWTPIDNDADIGTPTRFALYFTAGTTRKALLKAFDEFTNNIATIRKIRPDDRIYLAYGDKKLDTVSNVKRDRNWYWQRKQGKTYIQIALSDKNKSNIDQDDYKEVIRKAIKQYEKRLLK